MQSLSEEWISYGGMLATRAEVYKDALEVTGSARTADMYAFGPRAKELTPEDVAYRLGVGLRFDPKTRCPRGIPEGVKLA